MTKIKMADYAAWGLLVGGYIYSTTFIIMYGRYLGWLEVPPETKQIILLFSVSLFAMILGIAATRPKRLWLAAPLMVLLATHALDLTRPGCQTDICIASAG